MDYGRYLVELRESYGCSRRRLNERTGISLSYLHEIEKGDYLPGHENLRRIARALVEDEAGAERLAAEMIAERDRVEYQRMGLDPDVTLLAKEVGELSDEERKRFTRLYQRIKREREESPRGSR